MINANYQTTLITKSQICWWDSRKGGNPEGIVPMDQCHIDPVYKTIWINAKAGTEFFTASTDGMVSYIIFRKIMHSLSDYIDSMQSIMLYFVC